MNTDYALLPRHKIGLSAPGGGGEWFAEAFRGAWRRLPLGVRRALLRHWRRSGVRIAVTGERREYWMGGEIRGLCSDLGTQIWFSLGWVVRLPAEGVAALVAHELGHAFLAAGRAARMTVAAVAATTSERADTAYASMQASGEDDMLALFAQLHMEEELEVERLSEAWGFNTSSLG